MHEWKKQRIREIEKEIRTYGTYYYVGIIILCVYISIFMYCLLHILLINHLFCFGGCM